MYDAITIAIHVLAYYAFEKNNAINNLKLQKILYFLQANHLVQKNKPLFKDEIQAWNMGPVILNVYNEYKIFGMSYISKDLLEKESSIKLTCIDSKNNIYKVSNTQIYNEDIFIINEMLDCLENISSTTLLEIIHNQKPWKQAYYQSKIITNQSLYDFFKE